MTRSRTGSSICSWALVLAAVAAGGAVADVSVVDRWRDTGTLALVAGDVQVVLSDGSGIAKAQRTSAYGPVTIAELAPYGRDGARATDVRHCRAQELSPTEVECRIEFSGPAGAIETTLTLRDDGAIRVDPRSGMVGLSVVGEFAHALLPSRHVDDNVYSPGNYPDRDLLHLPAENMLVGLVPGGGHVLALVWPTGDQAARVTLGGQGPQRMVTGFQVDTAGQELYIRQFHADGIWRAQPLDASFEEQDVALDWMPPFEALWKTQLVELGVPTTFRGMRERRRPWRPTVGFYIWPLFEVDDTVSMQLHKRLAHTGEALIYALEGSPSTPYGFMTSVLSRAEQERIAELQAVEHYYTLDPDPVRGGFIINAHCAGRDQLKATTFAVGAQFMEREFLNTHISDRVHECEFIVEHHVRRSLATMDGLEADLAAWAEREAGNPAVLAYLQTLQASAKAMREEYVGAFKGESPEQIVERIGRVADRFRQVISQDAGLELAPQALALVNELNAIISMEEDQGRRFGTLSRGLFQSAAYECVGEPGATVYARAVRTRIREHLRHRQYESPQTAGRVESLLPED